MFNLPSLLERFKSLKDPKEKKSVVAKAILDCAQVSVSEKDITFQNGTIFISSSSLVKNRIFLVKAAIIEKINESLPELYIKDII